MVAKQGGSWDNDKTRKENLGFTDSDLLTKLRFPTTTSSAGMTVDDKLDHPGFTLKIHADYCDHKCHIGSVREVPFSFGDKSPS